MTTEEPQTFAGNPLIPAKRAKLSSGELPGLFREAANNGWSGPRVIPILRGRPLISTHREPDEQISWKLAWQTLSAVGLRDPAGAVDTGSDLTITDDYDGLVYLGEEDHTIFFAIDVAIPEATSAPETGAKRGGGVDPTSMQAATGRFRSCEEGWKNGFMDLRTLMVAADWGDRSSMEQLAIVGNARALLEWHKQSLFCGRCGTHTCPVEAGTRRQCTATACNSKAYPRTDPAVIMLVIDKERDCVVLGRQARFLPRMWSCLAGFTEAGESLEETVRRETREEVGLEVGEVVYHTSQPWPVGSSSMSNQIMIGFFAWAETVDIKVDERELADAKWFTREQVKDMLTFTNFRENQQISLNKIHKTCHPNKSDPKSESKSDSKSETGSVGPSAPPTDIPYVPGPYAIAHHLLTTWVRVGSSGLSKAKTQGLGTLEHLKSSI